MSEHRYMMATRAIHRMGDISREEPDLCVVDKDLVFVSHPADGLGGDCYVGMWVEGFGFFNVYFPVSTTRPLTEEEIQHYEKGYYQLAQNEPIKMQIRDHT